MSPVGSQWMSEQEKEQLAEGEREALLAEGAKRQALAATTAKAVKKAPALTPARVAEMLRAAAESGNVEALKEALSLGASPNTRERGRPKRSVLEVAVCKQHDAAALILLAAGALCAPMEWGYSSPNAENVAFAEYADSGAFKDKAIEAKIKAATLGAFLRQAARWSTLAKAKELLSPSESLESLAARAAGVGRWHIAKEAFLEGVGMGQAWEAAGERYRGRSTDPKTQGDRSALLWMLKTPEAVESVGAQAVERYFRAATAHDDVALLSALIKAGLRPSADWTIELDEQWDYNHRDDFKKLGGPQRVSLISFAAATEGGAAFEALKKTAPALSAAKKRMDHPWALRDIQVGRLMELHGLGARIDALDAKGGSVLHAWAREDKTPRAGWATMAREMPELFGKKDSAGKEAAERMVERLGTDKEVEAFRASLSRIESREIRREIPRESAKAERAKSSRL